MELQNLGSSEMPARAAAAAHWILRCSVGHDDGDLVDGAFGQQFGGDAQGEGRLAGAGGRDGQEVTRFGSQILHQRPSLPAP